MPLEFDLNKFKQAIGDDLYYYLIERYKLEHLLKKNHTLTNNDINLLRIGVATHATTQNLETNKNLADIFYSLTKQYDNWDLQDIKKSNQSNQNKLLETDIKKIEKIQIAKTYEIADQFQEVVKNETKQKELKSALYLAKDLAYRNFKHQSIIRILDSDGERRLYTVYNIANSKGLVCTAL